MPQRHHSAHQLRLLSTSVVLACAGLLALVVGAVTPAAASAAGTCPLTAMASASQPACWLPFAANSPFNTPLPASPTLAANSAAIVGRMVASGLSLNGSNTQFGFSPDFYGTRNVFFATPSDPTMTIKCENPVSLCTGANNVDVAGTTIHVPAGAKPNADSDAHMTVIEPATGDEYDFWDASVSGSTISAAVAAEVDVNNGDGLGSEGDAAEFGLSAGLVRPSELAAGQIDHALVVTVPCTDGSGAAGFVYPAEQGDGAPCGPNGSAANENAPALGQLLRLNMTSAQIQASGAPVWQKTIMTALAQYGAYVEDTGGSYPEIDILAQASASWTDVGQPDQWAAVAGQFGSSSDDLSSPVPISVGDLQVVSPCVPEGLCPSASVPSPAAPVVGPSPVVLPQQGNGSVTKRHHKRAKHKKQKRKTLKHKQHKKLKQHKKQKRKRKQHKHHARG